MCNKVKREASGGSSPSRTLNLNSQLADLRDRFLLLSHLICGLFSLDGGKKKDLHVPFCFLLASGAACLDEAVHLGDTGG